MSSPALSSCRRFSLFDSTTTSTRNDGPGSRILLRGKPDLHNFQQPAMYMNLIRGFLEQGRISYGTTSRRSICYTRHLASQKTDLWAILKLLACGSCPRLRVCWMNCWQNQVWNQMLQRTHHWFMHILRLEELRMPLKR